MMDKNGDDWTENNDRSDFIGKYIILCSEYHRSSFRSPLNAVFFFDYTVI